jgi:hypothetical protein
VDLHTISVSPCHIYRDGETGWRAHTLRCPNMKLYSSIFVVTSPLLLVDKFSVGMVVGSAHLSNINHFLVQERGKIPLSEASDGSYQPISDEPTISRQDHLDRLLLALLLLLLLLLADGPWLELLVCSHSAPASMYLQCDLARSQVM